MSRFAPLPLRRLVVAATLASLALVGTSSWAQSAVAGRALFENTVNAAAVAGITGSCTACHASIHDRRTLISGGPHAEISLHTAAHRIGSAIATVPAMKPFQALSEAQVLDLAAYVADTPEVSTDQLNFHATAINTMTASQFVDLRNSVAAPGSETLKVVKVEITGATAARFRRVSDTCDQATVPVGGSCRVTVDFAAPDSAGTIVPLVFTLRQGNSATTFSRTVLLNGAVATRAMRAHAAGDTDVDAGTGGGALGWPWLAALMLGTAALMLARHRTARQALRRPVRGR